MCRSSECDKRSINTKKGNIKEDLFRNLHHNGYPLAICFLWILGGHRHPALRDPGHGRRSAKNPGSSASNSSGIDHQKAGLGVLAGILITILFQSSTATTVILVGLTNAAVITLKQTMPVILGADIGTTVTAQLIALKFTELSLLIVGIGPRLPFFLKRTAITVLVRPWSDSVFYSWGLK